MKNFKKLPTKQLEKFSNIFMQLGLVLTLFVVYVVLEHQTEQKQYAVTDFETKKTVVIDLDQDIVFKKEPKPKPKKKILQKNVFLEDEPIKKGDNNKEESIIIQKPDEEPTELDLNTVEVEPEPEELFEDVPYDFVQNTPIFKGCEGLSEQENKKCFDKKMKKFVQRNFDTDLANRVGLASGKYKILTQFIIDNNGNVTDVKIRAPHKKLKSETDNLIHKLPKFTPGKQGTQSVKVRFTLPISFIVD